MKASEENLILLTNHFPYGKAEAFIEQELPFLAASFKQIHILTKEVDDNNKRAIPANVAVTRIDPRSSAQELVAAFSVLIIRLPKMISIVANELNFIWQHNLPSPFQSVRTMFHDLIKALIYSSHIDKTINRNQLTNVVVYSYWLNSSALATVLCKNANICKKISRAHGGDVYEHRNSQNYLSFRATLVRGLDHIFTISEDALQHLVKHTDHRQRISVSRLGTTRPTRLPSSETNGTFNILSCSFLLPVKRVNLIIEALSYIDDLRIQWYHIGDGPLLPSLVKLADERLGKKRNIRFQFMGSMTTTDLLGFYENHYGNLFINVSSSEGIPVTMMEAQSFGIPLIGPAVGGVPEIVVAGTGELIAPDASPQTIADTIRKLLLLPASDYEEMRLKARQNWETRFNAEENFSSFVTAIKSV